MDQRSITDEHARNVLAVALLSLMESKVPADVLQLLVHGSIRTGIEPNALSKALVAAVRFTLRSTIEVTGPPAEQIHVQFSDDHIRRWSREPFDGARTFAEIDNPPAQG